MSTGSLDFLIAKMDCHVAHMDTMRAHMEDRLNLMEEVYKKLKWNRYKNDFCLIFCILIFIRIMFY